MTGPVASSALMMHGTAAQVRGHCRQILDEAGGVGCFQGCSNGIVKGAPPANVEAMFAVR